MKVWLSPGHIPVPDGAGAEHPAVVPVHPEDGGGFLHPVMTTRVKIWWEVDGCRPAERVTATGGRDVKRL
ncbi:hypothetical protein [Methanoculleus sp. 10]|uniref:hypothetical protein n=1 Tax=Methanoculleus sp. 10 TaxID=430615 RepID=UPI001B72936A|nr:hypothetical protein [Methanoculleus sp. 10]MBP7410788.1 hypothetical protein [Methanoculleus sp.]